MQFLFVFYSRLLCIIILRPKISWNNDQELNIPLNDLVKTKKLVMLLLQYLFNHCQKQFFLISDNNGLFFLPPPPSEGTNQGCLMWQLKAELLLTLSRTKMKGMCLNEAPKREDRKKQIATLPEVTSRFSLQLIVLANMLLRNKLFASASGADLCCNVCAENDKHNCSKTFHLW